MKQQKHQTKEQKGLKQIKPGFPVQSAMVTNEEAKHAESEQGLKQKGCLKRRWRLGSESNRRTRICSPLHDHSATQPIKTISIKRLTEKSWQSKG